MSDPGPDADSAREFGPEFEAGYDPKHPWRMTLAEAERIVAAEAANALDTTDPAIARELAEAQRIVLRAGLWGGAPESVTRRYLRRGIWIGIGIVAFYAVALLVPLLLR